MNKELKGRFWFSLRRMSQFRLYIWEIIKVRPNDVYAKVTRVGLFLVTALKVLAPIFSCFSFGRIHDLNRQNFLVDQKTRHVEMNKDQNDSNRGKNWTYSLFIIFSLLWLNWNWIWSEAVFLSIIWVCVSKAGLKENWLFEVSSTMLWRWMLKCFCSGVVRRGFRFEWVFCKERVGTDLVYRNAGVFKYKTGVYSIF